MMNDSCHSETSPVIDYSIIRSIVQDVVREELHDFFKTNTDVPDKVNAKDTGREAADAFAKVLHSMLHKDPASGPAGQVF